MLQKTSHAFFNGKPKSLLMNLLLMAGLVFLSFSLQAQGWEKHYGTKGDDFGHAIIQTKDLGYLGVGYSNGVGSPSDFDVYIVKTDVDGKEIWSNFYNEGIADHGYGAIETPDNGYLIVGDTRLTELSKSNVYLLKIDDKGRKVWSKQFGGNGDDLGYRIISTTKSGGYLVVGTTSSFGNGGSDVYLIKLDAQGNEVWSKTHGTALNDGGRSVIEMADGYLVTGFAHNTANNSTDLYLLKIDLSGNKVWEKFYGGLEIEEGYDLIQLNDGNIALAGFSGSNSDVYVIKVTPAGVLIWGKTFGGDLGDQGFDMLKANNGDIVVAGITEIDKTNTDAYLLRIDPNGNKIWSVNIGRGSHIDWGQGVAPSHDNGFVVIGYNALFAAMFNDLTLIKVGSQGSVYTNRLRGKVFVDNNDCVYTSGENGLNNWIVRATSTTKTFYGTTDADGNFDIELDKGSYSVSLLVKNSYWNACIAAYNVNFNNSYDTLVRNFPVLQAVMCPLMEIDVSAPLVQSCSNVNYVVSYCNTGITRASSPSVHIILDKKLKLTTSTIPWVLQKDSLYIFNVNALSQQECGKFSFTATSDCQGINGQAYSVSARILPDTICVPASAQWDRASVRVNGYCDRDSVRFNILNQGKGDMQRALNFIVIEDHIMLRAPEPFQLRSTQDTSISIASSGATYRLIADQSPGHPGKSFPTIAVEGCTTSGSFSTGFVTGLQENENDPFISIDVQEGINSTDYTILRGYPKGYYKDGKFLIPANTDLEYHIFFKNSGPDTIRQVVIRDSLPAGLNIGSLVAGASSHPYLFEVYGNGVLKFTFDNMQLLPDGSANSLGFVKFKVSQKPDNPAGTEIPNSAAVFFGTKAPVKTSKLVHVVGKGSSLIDFIQVITDTKEPEIPGLEINVWPNPFASSVEFETKGLFFNQLSLNVYDMKGQLIRNETSAGNRLRMIRNELPAGTYAYKLTGDGKMLNTGKLIVR